MSIEYRQDVTRTDSTKQKDSQDIPVEIDTHYQLYGKRAWEVEYGEPCSRCNKRIDEFGFCACGSSQ